MRADRFLSFVFFLALISTGLQAQPANAIDYQGQLQGTAGPFSGQVDITFRLYDSATGGDPIGPELTKSGVAIEDGLFQVTLDFGQVLSGPRWFEIEVDGSLLEPRQRFAPVPVSLRASEVGKFASGEACSANADCRSGICQSNVCEAPVCSDGLKNGDETGVDCGGPDCSACSDGRSCQADGDCLSGVCRSRSCQPPTCSDGRANGTETNGRCD